MSESLSIETRNKLTNLENNKEIGDKNINILNTNIFESVSIYKIHVLL